ncbi:MAG: ATP-dependent Clp protease proteolytic subunit [Spirochaetota bacterium]|nr:ATP-dependent Clp protease proteolytic subunit [Spirochaetota bacterium]
MFNYLNNKEKEDEKEGEKDKAGSMSDKLLKARKIIISSEVDSKLANKVVNQLLLLEEDDPEKPITIFINSPGGEIFSGFAIFDMMKFVKPIIKTVVIGFAASMGSILALGAEHGHRYALTNAMFLIHQPLISGVYRGSAADIEIQAKEMINTKNRIINLYVESTGKTYDEIKKDIDRDFWMTAEQAAKYGPKALIDKVITSTSELE